MTTKKNFKNCHVRVFDADGLIYAADPNMNAYELTHKILDIQREQATVDTDKQLEFDIVNFFDDIYIDEWIDDVELYPHDRKIMELEEITDRLRKIYAEDCLIEYLNLDKPTPDIGEGVSQDILRVKVLLRSMGLKRYTGDLQAAKDDRNGDIKITLNEVGKRGFIITFPDGTNYDQTREDIEALIEKYQGDPIHTEPIDRQGVIVKVSHWQSDEEQVFAFPPNATFESVIENITVLDESYEAENEWLNRQPVDDPMDESVSPAEFDTVGYLRALVECAPGDQSFDELVTILQEYPESTICMMDEILERLREDFDDDFIFAHTRVDADMPGMPLRDSVIVDIVQMKVATFALSHHVYLGDGVFL